MNDLQRYLEDLGLSPKSRGGDEYAIHCPNWPNHTSDDAARSARINVASGLWHCACGLDGNEYQLRSLGEKNGKRNSDARHSGARQQTLRERPSISLAAITAEYEAALAADPDEPTLELLETKAIDPSIRIFGVRERY